MGGVQTRHQNQLAQQTLCMGQQCSFHHRCSVPTDLDAHLGANAGYSECHNNGELFGEQVAVPQQLGGGEAHRGMRAGEMHTPHPSSLLHLHPCDGLGGVPLQHKGQEIQREQTCRQGANKELRVLFYCSGLFMQTFPKAVVSL
ncbi:hypothetical protein EYF80_040905 [Liparis tanakae]|uniref:Uncharacterized protein n=1 Tax=Liparis tanakae TaxID=230148 RepID=A0A4Z2G8G2_9TELE|nr:hypothetical protein EYF80_040905 [Liparis tanakae]